MAKAKAEESAVEAVPEAPRVTGWRLRPRVGGEWVEVQADTLEDAVRAFNGAGGRGGRTLAAKQLEIQPPPAKQVL